MAAPYSRGKGKTRVFFNRKFWKAKSYMFYNHFLMPKSAFSLGPPHFFFNCTKETLPPPAAGDGVAGGAGWRVGWAGGLAGLAGWLVGWLAGGWLVGLAGWMAGWQRMVIGFDKTPAKMQLLRASGGCQESPREPKRAQEPPGVRGLIAG